MSGTALASIKARLILPWSKTSMHETTEMSAYMSNVKDEKATRIKHILFYLVLFMWFTQQWSWEPLSRGLILSEDMALLVQ